MLQTENSKSLKGQVVISAPCQSVSHIDPHVHLVLAQDNPIRSDTTPVGLHPRIPLHLWTSPFRPRQFLN